MDPAGAVADDVLGVLADERQARADAVRGVVHRWKAFPVSRPAVHVLLVAAAQELDPPELALVVQLLHEQVLAAVDDGLHHHVDLAALALRLHDLAALVDRRRRRHGAGDVLAGLERCDRLRRVIRDRRIDVDGVDVRVAQQILVARVARRDAEPVAARVELGLVAAADGVHLGVRVPLVDRNELGAEPEPDDGNTNSLVCGHYSTGGLRPAGPPTSTPARVLCALRGWRPHAPLRSRLR